MRAFLVFARLGHALPEAPRPTHNFMPPEFTPDTMYSGKPLNLGAYSSLASKVLPTGAERGRLPPAKTVYDAIGHLPREAAISGAPINGQTCHWAPVLGKLDRARIAALRPGQRGRDLPDGLRPKSGARCKNDTWMDSKFGRLEWDGVFSTVMASGPQPSTGSWFHPEANRLCTVRELAAAQGFPDSYVFHADAREEHVGTGQRGQGRSGLEMSQIERQYRQVGNAVPPPLAKAWGESILRAAQGLTPQRAW